MRYAVTGPRRILGDPAVIEEVFASLLDVSEVTTGAQFGVDTAAYRAAVSSHPSAVHRVVYPEGLWHNERVVDDARKARHLVVAVVSERSPLNPPLSLYLTRNERVLDFVEASLLDVEPGVLLAFPETLGEIQRSGTWACVRSARRRGIEVRVFR